MRIRFLSVSLVFFLLANAPLSASASFYQCIGPILKNIIKSPPLDPFQNALTRGPLVSADLKSFSEAFAQKEIQLSPHEASALFAQNRALYQNTFNFYEDTPASSFLKKFWSPRSQILGVIEKPSELNVFVHAGQKDFVETALPKTLDGRKISVTESPFGASASKKWTQKYGGNFYLEPPLALVTGASTGVGLSLVEQLQKQGYRVIATARAESLHRFAEAGLAESNTLLIRPLDVTQTAEINSLKNEMVEKFGGVDVVVNNAGFVYRGTLEETSKAELSEMMDANFLGPAELTRELVPTMRLKGRGNIVFISSAAATVSGPTKGAYSATKAAIEGFAEGSWMELEPYGVHVTTISPGFIHSDGAAKVRATLDATKSLSNPAATNNGLYNRVEKAVTFGVDHSETLPSDVANSVVSTLQDPHPRRAITVGKDAKFFKSLKYFGPKARYQFFMRSIMGLGT